MHIKSLLITAVFTVVVLPGIAGAQTSDVENTKMNERDRMASELTADDQGQSAGDLKMTQDIRQAVIADKSLSMNAHNVKIISKDGFVTLKGPVANDQEKNVLLEIASRLVGPDKIHNQLDVTNETSATYQNY